VKETGITWYKGVSSVERGDDSGSKAIVLGGSAIDEPRACEAHASASADRPASTLSGESPNRKPVTEGLPSPTTTRWVVRRKAAVVAAVRSGEITLEEACRSYQLSEEEFRSWERTFEAHGLAGLRVTRVQQYRGVRSARSRAVLLSDPESSFFRRA
jgi:hypothetical protein